MSPGEIEICNKCGRGIDSSEQAFIFNGEIVCGACDKKLRTESKPETSDLTKPDKAVSGKASPDTREKLTETKAGKITGAGEAINTRKSELPQGPARDTAKTENCRKCGRSLGKSEKFNVYNGAIVCPECYEKLSKNVVLPAGKKTSGELKSAKSPQEGNWIDEWNSGCTAGTIVSGLLAVIAFLPIISQLLFERIWISRGVIAINFIALMGTAICLWIRCFRRGFNLWRGLLTVAGGYITFFGLASVAYSFYRAGKFPGITSILVLLVIPICGALLLMWGFGAKKD